MLCSLFFMTSLPNSVRRTRPVFPAGLLAVTLMVAAAALSAPHAATLPRRSFGTPPHADLPFPHRKLANVTFVAFDTETTGVNPGTDRIVEIGAVKYRDGEIVGEKSWLINPGREIPWWAKRVHGISTEMVRDAPLFHEVFAEFESFVQGSVLVAHNAPFDIAFIGRELLRAGMEPPPHLVIDSLALFRTWFPELQSHALSLVAEHTQVTGGTFHRALADSMFVARIFNRHARTLPPGADLGDIYNAAGGVLRF